MDLKIFLASAIDEKEFNDFCANNIIYRTASLANGDIHVFYKDPKKVGNSPMEMIEALDKLIKQAEHEVMASQFNIRHTNFLLAEAEGKLAEADPNSKEW